MTGDASNKGRVLLVEDDEHMRTTLLDVLRDEGYSVAGASSVAGAEAAVSAASFDLLILDVMLPDGDGYALCETLRKRGVQARILMLTARTLDDDLVRGFDAGADDYLKKPYRLKELLARTRALVRRGTGGPAPVGAERTLRLGAHTIERAARRVVDERGREVELTRTELDLLLFFVDNAGRALSRNEILDAVWGRDIVVDERTVDNFVSSLKKKLGWTPEASFTIKSVRGVGYRMELDG